MKTIKLALATVIVMSLVIAAHTVATAAHSAATTTAQQSQDTTDPSLQHYLNVDSVNQVIIVQHTDSTYVDVQLWIKDRSGNTPAWDIDLSCRGYIGEKGMGKTRQGDEKTPIGDFGIITAFGIKPNPGTTLPYVDVNEYIYCCADPVAYNRIIDVRKVKHRCRGEHLINYNPQYNYGFFFDYNKECKRGKGAALFFHCVGKYPFTGGCVAVTEENMAALLCAIDINARLIIRGSDAPMGH
ncbi:MAG: hypothetical protein MJZ74_09345 [Muribaculaceae bacterium]|nr:hypothetical protein [Muribaculaceae bacterium]